MKFIIEAPEALNLMLNKLNLCLGLGLLAQMWPWIANTGLSEPKGGVGAAVPDQIPAACSEELAFGYPGIYYGYLKCLPWYLLWAAHVQDIEKAEFISL